MRVAVAVHLAAVALFAALAIALTWPLASHLHDGTLGAGIGDNATFVWNFWWIRKAMAAGASPFWTPALFAPLGTSLLLHTTTLLPTATATMLLPQADALATHNIALIATVFLNGVCAYGAAYALTRRPPAAIAAGITFAASPFLAARLQGHFNVLSAWGLPLLVMALARLSRRVDATPAGAPTATAAAGAGGAALVAIALAALAYTDYYFFIFGLALTALWPLRVSIVRSASTMPPTAMRGWVLRVSLIIALCLLISIVAIEVSGGTDLTIAGARISAHGTFNLRGALWIVSLIALAAWTRPRVRATWTSSAPRAAAGVAAAVLIVLISPLIVAAARTIASGDYATQTYLWRSAPPGIDIGALALGNPFHPLYGAWSRAAYSHLGIDLVESAVWPGVIPMACLAYAAIAARLRSQPETRRWLLITAVFFVWSLGPFLMTFGANSGFILPQSLLRYIPLLGNARVPGRAFVMVALGLALLVAIVLASTRKRTLMGLAAVFILLDYWPAPQPFVAFDRPAIYASLRARPAGPVLDLPFGIRDGFGERGDLDHRALFYQTIHEHPIAGGFVARLSPRVRQAYEEDALFAVLLGASPKPGAATLACQFRYVVVPKASGAPAVVRQMFELERLDGDDTRDLYRVTGCRAAARP